MIKKLLLVLCISSIFNLSAQTDTHNLNWFAGVGSNVDLTIETGDTVIWTWTSPNHTVQNDPAGTSVETFDSGFLAAIGSTFSYTFTTLGANDYFCGIHGAGSMSGTITVVAEGTLNVRDFEDLNNFSIYPNPVSSQMTIELPVLKEDAKVEIYSILGKKILTQKLNSLSETINFSKLNSGIYLVKVTTKEAALTKRFVKQ